MTEPVDVRAFLRAEFGWVVDSVEEVGRGAWSTAYRFDGGGRDLVIRVGRHVEDFEADLAAADHRSAKLPIPEVLHLGTYADEFCCVSTFAPGTPLESCSPTEWKTVVPSLVDALEAMRSCVPGRRVPSWTATLFAADDHDREGRLAGWRARIGRLPDAKQALERALSGLRSIDAAIGLDGVPLTLTHGDLINRNVHVDDGQVTGIFDWGCLRWGDHLYDLAWFDFWSPWHPDLDVGLLRSELDRRWSDAGYEVVDMAERERACLLHIAADHLIYHAVIDSPSGIAEVLARMADLDLI